MSDELARDVQHLWQAQPREEGPVSIDAFRTHVHRFDRNMRLLYVVNFVALFVGLAADPWQSSGPYGEIVLNVDDELLLNVGWGLTVAALVYVAYHGRAYQKWLSAPATLGLSACAELSGLPPEPRRDISAHPWRYLIAYLPGFALIVLGVTGSPTRASSVGIAALGVAFLAVVVWVNRTAVPGRRPADPR